MMPVEINYWRAAIGCFIVTLKRLSPLSKVFRPFSSLLQALKLCWFFSCFIAISTFALPIKLILQFLAIHFIAMQLCFLPLFVHVHQFAKTVVYVIVELLKRIPLGVVILVRHKYVHSQYAYFHIAYVACYILDLQCFVFRIILLSDDIKTNPGLDILDFYCWNLNSIAVHDF